MLENRLKLQELLSNISGVKKVYFQSPGKELMQYPCIKYSLSRPRQDNANNKIYRSKDLYEIMVIDYSPVSTIANEISKLPYCSFDRSYPSDNLNHFIFNLYY